jgi:heptosyltransferase-1
LEDRQERLRAGGERLRVLIVRIGAMGDVLHAMPAVAALRELHPDWFIGWAIEPRWSPLLQTSRDFDRAVTEARRSEQRPLVDAVYPVRTREWKEHPLTWATLKDVNGLRRELRAGRFDICVDMQGSIRSAIVGRMARAKRFVGMSAPRETQASWLYRQRYAVTARHVVEQGCELLGAAVGTTLKPTAAALPVSELDEKWCDGLLRGDEDPFVLMAPTAGWGAKQWPAERYGAVAAVLGRAGFRTLVNAVGADDAVGEAVVRASDGFAELVPCSVGQMIALTRRAKLVIGGDTGPLHLAAALEMPVVALFGPTAPARTGPFEMVEGRVRVLRHATSQEDHARHGATESGLMLIEVDEVAAAALELLENEKDEVLE